MKAFIMYSTKCLYCAKKSPELIGELDPCGAHLKLKSGEQKEFYPYGRVSLGDHETYTSL